MVVKSLNEYLIQDADYKGNYFLYAEGGMGKTTQLKNYNNYLLDEANNGSKTIPIYIDAKKIKSSDCPICNYIKDKFCKCTDISNICNMLYANQTYDLDYEFFIIVDGINETTLEVLKKIITDIKYIYETSNGKTRFIVSARNKIDLEHFKLIKLEPLSETCITDYVKKKFGVSNLNESLIRILQIPMFFKIFIETYKDSHIPNDYYNNNTIIRKSDLLKKFLEKLTEDRKGRIESLNNELEWASIEYFLPALAFHMAKDNINTTNKKILGDVYNNIDIPSKIKRPDLADFLCTISDNLSLIKELDTDKYVFVHQYWRDYFAANYIVNIIKSNKTEDLSCPVDKAISQFVGEILGECDFEGKNSIDTPMSPIEEFMQRNQTVLNDKPEAIRNLIEIMKASRNDCITGNYKNLNLSLSNFNDCFFRNSSFENSIIVDSTFFNNGHNAYIIRMLMLNDNKTLVSGDLHGIIKIWNVETSEIIDEIDTDSDIIFLGHWNNETIIAVCRNGKFVHYNINTRELTEYYLEYTPIHKVEMSSDCKYAVLNELDNIKVLTKKDDRFVCIKKINMGNSRVKSISISPDNKVFIYTNENNNMYLCSLDKNENGICVTNSFHIDRDVNGIFFKNNNTLIVDFKDTGFVEFSLDKSQPCKKLNSTPLLCRISYNSNTDSLALYDYNTNKLTLKTASKEITINSFINKSDFLLTLNISEDGKFVLIGTGRKNMIYIYDSQNLSLPYKTFLGQGLRISCYCESDYFFYFVTFDDFIYKVDKTNGRIIDCYNYKSISMPVRIAISSNEKYLAFLTIDSHGYYLLVIDVESREVLNKYKLDADIIEIAFSDDCNSLAVKYGNNKSQVFNISSTIDINDKNTLSIDSALDNLYEMKNFRLYRRQIYNNGNRGFFKKIDGQIIWKNNDLVNGCLINCNFQNAKYIGKNNSAFYKKLYLNGAIVPLELQ